MANGSDATLVAARAGNKERGLLFERYRGYLLVLARVQIGRRLQGKVDAADAVQDTFLNAHRAFAAFAGDTEAAFVGWLRGILASQIAHLVRRYFSLGRNVYLEVDIERELADSSQILAGGLIAPSSPSEQVARHEQAVRLADALEQLPPDYREVIVLRQLEELPFAEVATQMGRSVDSVQKLWVRALDRLRTKLETAP